MLTRESFEQMLAKTIKSAPEALEIVAHPKYLAALEAGSQTASRDRRRAKREINKAFKGR